MALNRLFMLLMMSEKLLIIINCCVTLCLNFFFLKKCQNAVACESVAKRFENNPFISRQVQILTGFVVVVAN